MPEASTDAPPAVQAWLSRHLGLEAPVTTRQMHGGLSNVTTVIEDPSGRRVVMRRPPDGVHGGGAHSVLREARILRAVGSHGVPVPRVLEVCEDPSVIGQPFVLMEFVDATAVDAPEVLECLPVDHRQRLSAALVDLMVSVQSVDVDSAGLSDLSRSTPYPQRQLRRWRSRWEETALRRLPTMDHVADRLEELLAEVPPAPDRLVHGDFRFGNVMIDAEEPPRIRALLDWELTTLGHHLADLGFLGARMTAPPEVVPGGFDPSAVTGCLTLPEVADRYRRATGLPTDELPVFIALSAWRWAVIAGGVHRRIHDGAMGDQSEDVSWHRRRVELLAELAESLLP